MCVCVCLGVCRAQLLAQAPQTENTYVRVPKTAGGGDGEAAAAAKPAAAAAPAAAPAAAAAASSDAAAAPAAVPEVPLEAVHALDIRVGRIISCERHPDAERCGEISRAGDYQVMDGADPNPCPSPAKWLQRHGAVWRTGRQWQGAGSSTGTRQSSQLGWGLSGLVPMHSIPRVPSC